MDITKELLIEMINTSQKEGVPEKDIAFKYLGKRICLNAYKKKFGIQRWPVGKSPMSATMKRKVVVNDNYFSEISLENCYYGGFIAADGNINKKSTVLTVGLSGKDKKHLETFLGKMGCNAKIYEYKQKGIYDTASISITSKKICHDLLENFNITPEKSLTYCPPDLQNKSLIDAFILGIIDGDGTVGFSTGKNRKRLYISLVGTLETITFVKKRFEEIIGHTTSNPHKKIEGGGNTYTIRVSDKTARTLFEHFYAIDVPKLDRKWRIEIHDYCKNFKRSLPVCRRRGVNVFNLKGEFISHFDTLTKASDFTGVPVGRISKLCREDCNNHMSGGYMFSRDKDKMKPYSPTNPFSRKMIKELTDLK